MTQEDFINRIGGTVKRRHKSDSEWSVCEIKSEAYAHYYYSLINHNYIYEF
jgi:hypothetical protein